MPYRDSHPALTYRAELDIALTHAASRKRSRARLAIECLRTAIRAAQQLGRPDLESHAEHVLAILTR